MILAGLIIFVIRLDAFKDLASVSGTGNDSVIGCFYGSKQIEALTKRIETVLYDYDAKLKTPIIK